MYGIAAVVAFQALGVGSLPPISVNVAEGFAAGALLCGACLLPVIAPRRTQQRAEQPKSRQQDARRPARALQNRVAAAPGDGAVPPLASAAPGDGSSERDAGAVQTVRPAGRRSHGRHAAPSGRVVPRVRIWRRRVSGAALRD